jgi:hypothetical protein
MMRALLFVAALAALLAGIPFAGGASADPLVQPPTINPASEPPNPTNVTSATLQFSDSDPAVTTFQCQLDNSGFSDCSSGSASYSSLSDSSHTFEVKAIDAAQNESDVTPYTWVVDTTPPPVPTIDSHASLEGTASTTFTFTSAGATGFECRVDAAAFSPCSSGDSFGPFSDGPHTFFVRALDELSNPSDAASAQWTIDTTAPTGSLEINSGATLTGSTAVTLNLHADDGAGSGIAGYRIADGLDCSSASFVPVAPVSPYDQDVGHTLPSGDGVKTVCVQYEDAAGNPSPTYTDSITLDTQSAIATVNSGPHDPTNQTGASFTFSSSKSPSTFRCRLDGDKFASCTSPKVYTGLADGSHTFSVRATYLGNQGPITDYTWTIDTVAPDTAITSTPPASSTSANASFAFTSSEAGSAFACSLDAGGFTPCASPAAYAGLGDGAHTFRVQAVDAAGNVDTTPAVYSWQIAGVGPGIDRTPPANVQRLKRSVGYRLFKLVWTPPSDTDFDHVKVFVSTSPKSPPRTMVYNGTRRSYTNKRFKNGFYYRYAVLSYDRVGNASKGAGVAVPPSVLLRSPRDRAVVKSPPRLVWASVPHATFYNVQLYSPNGKLLSAWPAKTAFRLSRSWVYQGRHFHLKKGLYRWFVWPGFGRRSKARYGQLLGQASFRVS